MTCYFRGQWSRVKPADWSPPLPSREDVTGDDPSTPPLGSRVRIRRVCESMPVVGVGILIERREYAVRVYRGGTMASWWNLTGVLVERVCMD